jgi:lipoate-protein ligase A
VTGPPFRHDSFTEPAREFHDRDLLSDPTPRVVECHSTRSSLVLGSVQRFTVVDDGAVQRHGIDVTRRRSGGGAVLVVPDGIVWFDVVVPGDDPRFAAVSDDVTKSMRWLGGHLLTALGSLEVGAVAMHDGPMTCTDWCRLVCFAGTATGEIELDGRKLVGISQRRSRNGSRFQCAVHTTWAPDLMVSLLAPPRPTAAQLPPVATLDASIARDLPRALVRVLNGL